MTQDFIHLLFTQKGNQEGYNLQLQYLLKLDRCHYTWVLVVANTVNDAATFKLGIPLAMITGGVACRAHGIIKTIIINCLKQYPSKLIISNDDFKSLRSNSRRHPSSHELRALRKLSLSVIIVNYHYHVISVSTVIQYLLN